MKQIIKTNKYELIRNNCNHALINQTIQINKLDYSGNIREEIVLSYDDLKDLFNIDPLSLCSKLINSDNSNYQYLE